MTLEFSNISYQYNLLRKKNHNNEKQNPQNIQRKLIRKCSIILLYTTNK